MRHFVALAGIAVAFSGLACAHVRADREAEKRALIQADSDFDRDVAARGVEAWVAVFAPEGRMFPANQTAIHGASAIRELMANLGDPRVKPPELRLRWIRLGFIIYHHLQHQRCSIKGREGGSARGRPRQRSQKPEVICQNPNLASEALWGRAQPYLEILGVWRRRGGLFGRATP